MNIFGHEMAAIEKEEYSTDYDGDRKVFKIPYLSCSCGFKRKLDIPGYLSPTWVNMPEALQEFRLCSMEHAIGSVAAYLAPKYL